MYEDVYGYPCPPPPPPRPPPPPLQSSWNADMDARRNYWPGAPHDFSRRPPPPMHLNRVNNGHHHGMQRSPWRYGESPDGPRHYSPRFNNNHFGPVSQPRWQRNSGWLKRPRPEHEAPPSNKRQKQLKGDCEWTRDDAERALQMEKDYMRKAENNLLIIKFPDPELNKNIVCKLHPEIKDVHFQQQSTARFCFVTLQQTANPDEVIESLNRQKFGDGHLTASYKRDRDPEDIDPEDIDPFTLYVGNLAKDVTEEDILKMYPKCRRIDIGYAMRMKFTRYAFVGFRTLEDCTEAFRRTHSMEMNSKNLIIRFRRIHGHVGLPGETKWRRQLRNSVPPPPPPPPAVKDAEEVVQLDDDEEVVHPTPAKTDLEPVVVKDETKPPEVVDVDVKPTVRQEYVSPFKSGSLDAAFAQIKAKVKRENVRVKNERDPIKQEPSHSQDPEDDPFCKLEACISPEESDEDDYVDDEGDDCALEEATNFHILYSNMLSRVNIYNSLKEIE